MVVSVAGQKHSMIVGILTCVRARQENTYMREVGERKESIRLINDNLKQNSRSGEVLAQCYSMVKYHMQSHEFYPFSFLFYFAIYYQLY